MTTGGPLRSALFCAVSSLGVLALCALGTSRGATLGPADWEQIRTKATPRVIQLPGDSYIEIAPRSSANLTYVANQPSVHLSSGRLNANLFADAKTSARFSAPQVFVRASDGYFFMVNDNGRTTIGVCRGTITGLAGKRDSNSSSPTSTGEFTIVAGEQAIISGDGTIMKEQDPAMDCAG